MKIILSRKGFDSSNGGVASPIMTDGTMLSLPIPASTGIDYNELFYKNKSYKDIIYELGSKDKRQFAHLDPDIREDVTKREDNWRPIFGQCGAAETHLENNCVEIGDIFLFFGWFRKARINESGTYKYEKKSSNIHAIYGYLQIGEIIRGKDVEKYKWHPHASYPRLYPDKKNNTLYVASDRLVINGEDTGCSGSGVLKYSDEIVLTYPGMSRSKWSLPSFFRNVRISFHSEKSWKDGYFKSAAIGQEFVISESDDITNWAKKVILNNIDKGLS